MADPLSVSVSILGLVPLAEAIIRNVCKYIKTAERVEDEVFQLSSEVSSLYGILNGVQIVSEELDEDGTAHVLDQRHIHDCHATLLKIQLVLSEFKSPKSSDRFAKTLKKKLKWPLKRSETLEFKDQIQSHKLTLSVALNTEGISKTIELYKKTSDVERKVNGLVRKLEVVTRITLSKEREEVLCKLSPIDPLSSQKANHRIRHPGTGLWFLDSQEFINWLSIPKSKLWVHGIPGAGKTILASAAIERSLAESNKLTAIAYFYCDYKYSKTHDPEVILGSLAQQLARQNETSFTRLEDFVKTHTTGFDNEEISVLIHDMSLDFEDVMILVDGVDECGDNMSKVMASLVYLPCQIASIKVLIFSRDLPQISDFTEGFEKISIAARNNDLKLYVGAQIEERMKKTSLKRLYIKDKSLKEEIMETLINGADGMFRWVALQLDLMCELPTDRGIRNALKSLPPDIFSSYERLLEQINQKPRSVQKIVSRALHYSHLESLNTAQLCDAISVEIGAKYHDPSGLVEIDQVCRLCGCLVRLSQDGHSLELAHFTVEEFLFSIDPEAKPELAQYRLDIDLHSREFTRTALTYLCYQDFSVPCKSEDTFQKQALDHPFLTPASDLWSIRITNCAPEDNVWNLAKQLFSHDGNLQTWAIVKATRFTFLSAEQYDDVLRMVKTMSPIHFASLIRLPELCKLLLDNGLPSNCHGPMGTPIHCALLGFSKFCRICFLVRGEMSLPEDIAVHEGLVMQTIEVFLSAGAQINEYWCYRGSRKSTLRIAIDSFPYSRVQVKLLEAGCFCESDAMERLVSMPFPPKSLVLAINPGNVHKKDRPALLNLIEEAGREQTDEQGVSQEVCLLKFDLREDENIPTLLFSAARNGYLELIDRILKVDPDFVHLFDEEGSTPLHLAAQYNQLGVMKHVISHGADINAANDSGSTPLHTAIYHGSLNCFKELLTNGADIEVKTKQGKNPWHLAAQSSADIILLLMENTQNAVDMINERDNLGFHSLAYAVDNQPLDIIELFLAFGADEKLLCNGGSVLHSAARGGNLKAVEFFLARGCDPSLRNEDSLNALQYALLYPNVDCDIVQVLIDHDPHLVQGLTESTSAVELLFDSPAFSENEAKFRKLFMLITQDINGYASRILRRKWPTRRINTPEVSRSLLKVLTTLQLDTKENVDGDCSREFFQKTLSELQTVNPRLWLSRSEFNLIEIACLLSKGVANSDLWEIKIKGKQVLNISLRYSLNKLTNLLLTRSPDVDKRDGDADGYSPIETACMCDTPLEIFDQILHLSRNLELKHPDGNTLLHFAMKDCSTISAVKAKRLIDAGLQVNAKGADGLTPLHMACYYQNIGNIRLLVSHGADGSIKNAWTTTPVHFACLYGSIQHLQELEGKIQWWEESCNVIVPHNNEPYEYVRLTHIAAMRRDLRMLRYLLQTVPAFSVDDCAGGPTLLFIAVTSQSLEIITYLLGSGANPSLPNKDTGLTPLHEAAKIGNMAILTTLLEYGAEVNVLDKQNLTPRLHALRQNHTEIAKKLGTRAEKRPSQACQSELAYAIKAGDLTLCNQVLEQGASVSKPCSPCGRCNALIFAFIEEKVEVASILIDKGAPLSHQTCNAHPTAGFTVLHYCSIYGWVELVDVILDKCPGLLFVHTFMHPIHIAIYSKQLSTLKALLTKAQLAWERYSRSRCFPALADRHAAIDPKSPILNQRSRVKYEITGPDLSQITIRLTDCEFKGLWQDYLHQVNADGFSPLHLAALEGHVGGLQLLLEHGAKIDCTTADNSTPLHVAISNQRREAVHFLLHHGASPHLLNPDGNSAYWMAAKYGDTDLFDKFEASAGPVSPTGYEKETIIDALLARTDSVDLLSRLLDRGFPLAVPESTLIAPFYQCIRTGTPSMKGYLLNSGHDISILNMEWGSCLHVAWTNASLLRMVLKRVGREVCPKLLNFQPRRVRTPLYETAGWGHPICVELLLKYGADLDVVGGELGTPLMAAATMGRLEMVKTLVDAGSKLCYIEDGEVFSVLEMAKDFTEIVKWLLYDRWTRWRFIGPPDDAPQQS